MKRDVQTMTWTAPGASPFILPSDLLHRHTLSLTPNYAVPYPKRSQATAGRRSKGGSRAGWPLPPLASMRRQEGRFRIRQRFELPNLRHPAQPPLAI